MSRQSTISDFLRGELENPGSGYSIGVPGAIAEFMRNQGRAEISSDGGAFTATTEGGALRVELVPGVQSVTGGRQVALCLERNSAAMGGRRVLTELGEDVSAVDPSARGQVRFDLGLGIDHVDACIRSGDPDLIAALRGACGRRLLDEAAEIRALIVDASPTRVFCSRLGRIEVETPIPKDKSPMAPHTHLLPHLLGTPGPMDDALPRGFVSCLDVYTGSR